MSQEDSLNRIFAVIINSVHNHWDAVNDDIDYTAVREETEGYVRTELEKVSNYSVSAFAAGYSVGWDAALRHTEDWIDDNLLPDPDPARSGAVQSIKDFLRSE